MPDTLIPPGRGSSDVRYQANDAQTRNVLPTTLSKWRSGVAQAIAGTGYCKILCVGDSTTWGHQQADISTTISPNSSWPKALANLLTGYLAGSMSAPFPAYMTGSTTNYQYDFRWTLGGSWGGSNVGFGNGTFTHNAVNGDTLTWAPDYYCDTFDVYVIQNGSTGTLSMAVTGNATPVTATTNATNGIYKFTVVAGSRANNNVITFTQTGAGQVYVAGVEAYDSTNKGIRVMQWGHGGTDTFAWNNGASYSLQGALTNTGAALQGTNAPNLVILNLGINDAIHANTVVQYQSNMQALIGYVKSNGADCMLMAPFIQSSGTVQALLTQMAATLPGLAAANNVPLIDIAARWGNTYQSVYNSGDGIHPNKAGYIDAAREVFNTLTRV